MSVLEATLLILPRRLSIFLDKTSVSGRLTRDDGHFVCIWMIGLVDGMNQSLLASAERFPGISVAGVVSDDIAKKWLSGHLGYVAKLCINVQ